MAASKWIDSHTQTPSWEKGSHLKETDVQSTAKVKNQSQQRHPASGSPSNHSHMQEQASAVFPHVQRTNNGQSECTKELIPMQEHTDAILQDNQRIRRSQSVSPQAAIHAKRAHPCRDEESHPCRDRDSPTRFQPEHNNALAAKNKWHQLIHADTRNNEHERR